MQERTQRMMRDFDDFQYRYPAVAAAIAKAPPSDLVSIAKRHDFLLDPRGAPYAMERALDLQFGAWVEAALKQG